MEVSRISPAPRSCSRTTHSTASSPVGSRPPRTMTSPPSPPPPPPPLPPRPAPALRVDRGDHALAPELVGQAGHERGIAHRSGVDGHLVRPRAEHLPRVRHAADPASNSKRNEQPVSDAAHQIDEGPALLVARRDIEEDDLIRPLGVVARGLLCRVARVPQLPEVHPLHDPPPGDVQTGDEPPR